MRCDAGITTYFGLLSTDDRTEHFGSWWKQMGEVIAFALRFQDCEGIFFLSLLKLFFISPSSFRMLTLLTLFCRSTRNTKLARRYCLEKKSP